MGIINRIKKKIALRKRRKAKNIHPELPVGDCKVIIEEKEYTVIKGNFVIDGNMLVTGACSSKETAYRIRSDS